MQASKTRFGTFDELVAAFTPEITQIARQLRTLILAVHPDTIEVTQ